ncbi:MAG: preprotein translocase subunit YajC [Myxococcota bacterium]|nr:preprotein translocase subunit YajC [Myxococcota bacterium]
MVAAQSGAAEQGAEQKSQGDFLTQCGPQILMLAVMFAIFYFLLIRPQQKKAREHQELLKRIQRGDKVITNGGILGTVTGIDDKWVVLEVSEKVRIKVLRSHIAGKGDAMVDPGAK